MLFLMRVFLLVQVCMSLFLVCFRVLFWSFNDCLFFPSFWRAFCPLLSYAQKKLLFFFFFPKRLSHAYTWVLNNTDNKFWVITGSYNFGSYLSYLSSCSFFPPGFGVLWSGGWLLTTIFSPVQNYHKTLVWLLTKAPVLFHFYVPLTCLHVKSYVTSCFRAPVCAACIYLLQRAIGPNANLAWAWLESSEWCFSIQVIVVCFLAQC